MGNRRSHWRDAVETLVMDVTLLAVVLGAWWALLQILGLMRGAP